MYQNEVGHPPTGMDVLVDRRLGVPMVAPSPRAPERRWAVAADSFSRWRHGDESGLDELVRICTPSLWHLARAYGLERHAAEDVVQTTWLALVRRRDQITDPQTVMAWLATTTRRESWRVSKTATRVSVIDGSLLDEARDAEPLPEEEALRAYERRRLWHAVQQLTHRCQRLLRVIAFEDRPDYRKLASEFEMPIGSIGPTRGRCLQKLRALLEGGVDA